MNLTFGANSVASLNCTFFGLKTTVESTSNFCHPFAKVAETYYYLVDSFANQRVMWKYSALKKILKCNLGKLHLLRWRQKLPFAKTARNGDSIVREGNHSSCNFVSVFSALWDLVLDNTICGEDLVFRPVSLNQYESFGQKRALIFFLIFVLKSPRPILLSL